MKATPYGRGVFLVESANDTRTVDCLANKGAGKCDCFAWVRAYQPRVEEDKRKKDFDPSNPNYKCPHIQCADRALLQMFKDELNRTFNDSHQTV